MEQSSPRDIACGEREKGRWVNLPWYRNPFGKLMIASAVVWLIVSTALALWIPHKQDGCDRSASADLVRLAAAFEMYGNELVDLGLPREETMEKLTEGHLYYLPGSYYGWRGTTNQCNIRVRKVGKELWACSLWGARPSGNKDERRIFRANAISGRDIPEKVGRCEGLRIPSDRATKYYHSSMIVEDLDLGQWVLTEPKDYNSDFGRVDQSGVPPRIPLGPITGPRPK